MAWTPGPTQPAVPDSRELDKPWGWDRRLALTASMSCSRSPAVHHQGQCRECYGLGETVATSGTLSTIICSACNFISRHCILLCLKLMCVLSQSRFTVSLSPKPSQCLDRWSFLLSTSPLASPAAPETCCSSCRAELTHALEYRKRHLSCHKTLRTLCPTVTVTAQQYHLLG